MRSYNTWKRKYKYVVVIRQIHIFTGKITVGKVLDTCGISYMKYERAVLLHFRADMFEMADRSVQNKGFMKKKWLCLCAIVLLDLYLGGIVCRMAVEAPREVSGKGAQAEQMVSAPECTLDGELALTFDDGPHKVYTKKLLDGLRERGVKASFFLVGENIPGNEELVRQMAKDGHLIGVHCMAHVDLARQPLAKSVEEIQETADRIEAVAGKRPEYIRPPYGSWSTELQEKVSMTPVFWDVDTLDWKNRNTARIVKHICKNAAVHTVVLMHDAYQTSVDAALEAIDTLAAEGYTFVTIEECLID